MPDIQYDFEELPLLVGKDKAIAFLSGRAEINFVDREDWAIVEVRLDDVSTGARVMTLRKPGHTPTIDLAHFLWAPVTAEIERRHGDAIVEQIEQAARPDPDTRRDLRREAA